jgi:hypothetical protein
MSMPIATFLRTNKYVRLLLHADFYCCFGHEEFTTSQVFLVSPFRSIFGLESVDAKKEAHSCPPWRTSFRKVLT